jgi:hypothetical protein
MLEIVLGMIGLGLLGYFAFKIVVKHETPREAFTEIKDEIAYEAKHIEVVVEHKLEDVLHSLEDQVAARAKTVEKEQMILAAKWKHNEEEDGKNKH